MKASRPPVAAVVRLLVAMLSFQAGASAAKQLIPAIGAPGATAIRLGLAALIVGVLQRPWRRLPSRASLSVLLVYGLALGTMNFVFYLSLRTIPLGLAVALEFTGPLTVALLYSRHRTDLVWIGLAVFGLLVLLPTGLTRSTLDPVGVAWALTAGACWALYIVFGQKAGRVHPAATSAWGMLIAATVIVPIGVASAGRAIFAPSVLPLGLAVAVLSSALPYSLEMPALRQLSAKAYGILMSLQPAVAALVGLMVLDERLTVLQWLAVGALVAASVGTVSKEAVPAVPSPQTRAAPDRPSRPTPSG